MTPSELRLLTDGELAQLFDDVRHEQQLRQIPSVIETLNANYLAAEGVVPGQEWRQPTGAHDAYPKGWEAPHLGKNWVSDVSGNVWEPGVANWHEVVPEGAPPPEFVHPTNAEDTYNTGDRVTFNGVVYTSTIDNNAWSPLELPSGWQADPS